MLEVQRFGDVSEYGSDPVFSVRSFSFWQERYRCSERSFFWLPCASVLVFLKICLVCCSVNATH